MQWIMADLNLHDILLSWLLLQINFYKKLYKKANVAIFVYQRNIQKYSYD